MEQSECLKILEEITLPCHDDGRQFADNQKTDKIDSFLRNTNWIKTEFPLGRLYSKKPIEEMRPPLILISTHIDIVPQIKKPFVNITPSDIQIVESMAKASSGINRKDIITGTFDNSITNAAILTLMLEKNSLPDNAAIAFTGNEESGYMGATEIGLKLKAMKKKFRAMVLDVTWEGWENKCSFTIENDFWGNRWGKAIVNAAEKTGFEWDYVPVDPTDIPSFVPHHRISENTAMPDEAWAYDNMDAEAFSLCLPISGSMHSEKGALASKNSFMQYLHTLAAIANIEI